VEVVANAGGQRRKTGGSCGQGGTWRVFRCGAKKKVKERRKKKKETPGFANTGCGSTLH
jgi:hypothetical protein